MRSEPDQETARCSAPNNNFVINQFLFKLLGYDPLASFEPITIVSDAPSVIVVQPSLKVSSLRELQGVARSSPEKLNYGFTLGDHPISRPNGSEAGRRQSHPYSLSRFAGGDPRDAVQ